MAVPTVAAITARLSWIPCSCAERVSTSVATILVSPWLSGGLRAVRPANSAPTARQVQVRAARGFCVAAGPHGGKATPARARWDIRSPDGRIAAGRLGKLLRHHRILGRRTDGTHVRGDCVDPGRGARAPRRSPRFRHTDDRAFRGGPGAGRVPEYAASECADPERRCGGRRARRSELRRGPRRPPAPAGRPRGAERSGWRGGRCSSPAPTIGSARRDRRQPFQSQQPLRAAAPGRSGGVRLKLGQRFAVSMLVWAAACGVAAGAAQAETDPSFLLTATPEDFAAYFPSYLANGYLSTMTGPRGTEGNLAYVVAFMDYARDDIARPAAIPGWSGIDYSTGGTSAGEFWLDQTKLSAKAFANYSQTLHLHYATLSPTYRYTADSQRSTDVRVTSFVSQASQHLAATRIAITPDFSGTVRLRFSFALWAPHQPRFPIRTMNGEEMLTAVDANNMSVLEPVNAVTADRAPVWYHGDTHVLAQDGDASDLTLWLDGRAEQGLAMAEAAAIGLPEGASPSDVKLIKGPHRLGLLVSVPVEKGRTYKFAKYTAVSREGWGGDAKATLAFARAARASGFDALLEGHVSAWHELWQSEVLIGGGARAPQALHSDLYYLLSNTTVGTAWPMGACALTPNYAGHAFWDSDSWVFPALLLLYPERAKPIVMFRQRTMQPARERARQYGVRGTMYPWEADPQTGVDHTPYFAYGVWREIHGYAVIAIAQWQYYLFTADLAWLREYC